MQNERCLKISLVSVFFSYYLQFKFLKGLDDKITELSIVAEEVEKTTSKKKGKVFYFTF